VKEKGYYPVGGCGANIAWHTEDDTMEIADRDNLLRDMKVYAAATFRAANSTIYPLDFRATAREFAQTLARYQDAAGTHFDFTPAKDEVEALEDDLERFYDAAHALMQKSVTDPQVRRANEIQRRLGRVLVCINYSRAGQFRHDPAVNVPALPDLEPATKLAALAQDGDAYRMTRTHLARGRNRVVAALREARRILEDAQL
jgi:hypothetical protein